MKKLFIIISLIASVLPLMAVEYSNPVIASSTPDPTVVRGPDGYFYLYATEDIRNTPVYRSSDLVNWKFMGTAFTNSTRPTFEPKGGIWAPDINYINNQYVLYYSLSVWGGEQTCGIGVATGRTPTSFTDRGKLFRSNEIGVQNSIDPFYYEEDGKKYLFWGSFRGIYYVELSDDGLSLKYPENPNPQRIAGTAFEGTYIHKRGKYYYLFASVGSCCEGLRSSYRLVMGRSESLLGPYVSKQGVPMLDNGYTEVIHSNTRFKGNGHCSEIMQDDAGNDWIFYHGYDAQNEGKGRQLLMSQVKWDSRNWPYVEDLSPAETAPGPVFGVSSVKEIETDTPVELRKQNNTLQFQSYQPVSVKIFAIGGQMISSYDKCDEFQIQLASGMYFLKINTNLQTMIRKIYI